MRSFICSTLVVLTLLTGSMTMLAPQVHAQATTGGTQSSGNNGAASSAAQSGTPGGAAAAQTPSNPSTFSAIFDTVMTWIVSLFAWLLGVAAITLDNAVYYTVVTMGNYVNKLSAIGVAWRILRDIGNIVLIFGFIAIGVATMLDTESFGFKTSMLPTLLISAVFLNFSLFISEAVIDVGNVFATQFYTAINGGQQATSSGYSDLTHEGISNKIMNQLGLQTLFGNAAAVAQTNNANATITNGPGQKSIFDTGHPFLIGFMAILLFTVAAFVMFSLAFILIARFVALVFLIIVAPIGFAGLAIPKLEGLASDWWHQLFEQTVTAPVMLLLLYVALAVITDSQFIAGYLGGGSAQSAWSAWLLNESGAQVQNFAGLILAFLVAMGLLLAVVVFAKKMSAFGAAWATGLAGKLSFNVAGKVGRTALGWPANAAARGLRQTRFARIPILGTNVVKGLDKVASGSFDVRGTSLLKNFPGGGVNAGTAQKGGYKAELKKDTEARTKYAKELKGRELTADELVAQKTAQKQIKDETKNLDNLRARRLLMKDDEIAASGINTEIEAAQKNVTDLQKKLEALESVSDTGAQRKYAANLNLEYLGLDEKGTAKKVINFFNPRANTDAAKKIKLEAKKSKNDKQLENIKKAIEGGHEEEEKKEEKKEEGGGEKKAAGGHQ